METIHDQAHEISQTLGCRVRAMRESREWTQELLAEKAGLSKAYLSRLEAGDRQPSLSAISSIAKAFGISIAALFEHPDQTVDCVIVRATGSDVRSANGLTYRQLSGSTKPFNLQPIALTVPADRPGNEHYQHDGEEWLYVTSGRLRLSLDGRFHDLVTGDSVHFDSRLPHRLQALDGKEATVILVACPIPTSLNHIRQFAESTTTGRFAGHFAG
jgi:DNA-binding XRE family transcriptional regulator/quercetin dioxygenase-like cupin family protein